MQATQTTPETWLPVPGFEGSYEVSDLGRVRSLDRVIVTKAGQQRRLPGRMLRPTVSDPGYPFVQFGKHDAPRRIHNIVTLAFLGPCPEGMEVRHLNGDKLDNTLSNLRYGTHSENVKDTSRHGRHFWANKPHCPQGHEYTPENIYRRPGTVNRYCRECRRLEHIASRAKRRAAAKEPAV